MVVVGERVKFLEHLRLLKKHRKDADRSKALWTATTPVTNCAYHEKCGGFCFHVCQNKLKCNYLIIIISLTALLSMLCPYH